MESTLSLQYADLQGEIGFFLGYGRGAAFKDPTWTDQQSNAIEASLKSGLRQFYYPIPLGGTAIYDWSFLKPFVSLTLALNASTVTLPDDYGGVEGDIVLSNATTANQVTWPIQLYNEGYLRQRAAELPTATGRPLYAAEQVLKGTAGTQGQRKNLLVWPAADAAYTLRFCYYILPDYLSGALPYAYGGAQHAETLLASCKMAAEETLDDNRGIWATKFQERLIASIGLDRRNKPQILGYNGDRSDNQGRSRLDKHWDSLVTVKGTQY